MTICPSTTKIAVFFVKTAIFGLISGPVFVKVVSMPKFQHFQYSIYVERCQHFLLYFLAAMRGSLSELPNPDLASTVLDSHSPPLFYYFGRFPSLILGRMPRWPTAVQQLHFIEKVTDIISQRRGHFVQVFSICEFIIDNF